MNLLHAIFPKLFRAKGRSLPPAEKEPGDKSLPAEKEAGGPTIPGGKPADAQKVHDGPYLTETVVCGGMDAPLCFVDEKRGIRKTLVDNHNRFQDFPGVEREEFWTQELLSGSLEPSVRFRLGFEKRGNRWIVLWEIQPDGRFWADEDGFGMESDQELTLYTYLDQSGNYTGPFRIFRVGSRPYTLDRFAYASEHEFDTYIQKLEEGNLETHFVEKPEDVLFPHLQGTPSYSRRRNRYGLWGRTEALAYWQDPLFAQQLLKATKILLHTEKNLEEIVNGGYESHIHACMTLFWLMTGEEVFCAALDKFFAGKPEPATQAALEKEPV